MASNFSFQLSARELISTFSQMSQYSLKPKLDAAELYCPVFFIFFYTDISDVYVSFKVKSNNKTVITLWQYFWAFWLFLTCPLQRQIMMCLLLIRLWFPGARDNSFNDLRYIWGGFAYLQDMMDHGIIRAQTSKTQPLGVYAQQMPYPCFVDDGWVQKLLSVSLVIRGRGRRYHSNKIQLTLGSCHSLPPHSWVIVLSVTLSLQISSWRLEDATRYLYNLPFLYYHVALLRIPYALADHR